MALHPEKYREVASIAEELIEKRDQLKTSRKQCKLGWKYVEDLKVENANLRSQLAKAQAKINRLEHDLDVRVI